MTTIEKMMKFMFDRLPKEDIEEMIPVIIGDMSSEERRELMASMMPKMMEGMNMKDMMPKMMGADVGCRPQAGTSTTGARMTGTMADMLPHCLTVAAKQVPADERTATVVHLLVALVESGCQTIESSERPALFHALKARLEALESSPSA